LGLVWSVKLPWTAVFDTECEFCGKSFSFNQTYFTFHSQNGGTRERAENAAYMIKLKQQQTLLNKYGHAGHFSMNKIMEVRPCPECGYIQSWMTEHAKNKKNRYRKYRWLVGFLLLLMVIPFGISLNSPEKSFGPTVNLMVQLLTACLATVFVFSLYKAFKFNRTFDPNAGVLQNHPAPIQKKSPRINFLN
jgi:hypothetical protein